MGSFNTIGKSYGVWDLPIYLNRINPIPLDKTSVFTALTDATSYVEDMEQMAYAGQLISVAPNSGEVQVYKVSNERTLIPINSGGTVTSLEWSKITDTPTTLSGYGIIDAYTSAQTDSAISTALNGYATQTWVKSVSDLVNYYTSGNTYTKTEVNDKLSSIPKFKIEVVDELPTSGISTTTVYLVRNETSTGSDLYNEWIYVNNTWELLGRARVDLTNYYNKTEVDTLLASETARTESTYLKEHQSLDNYYTSAQTNSAIAQGVSGKQDTISDLEDIRKGAASGATAFNNAKGWVTEQNYATEQWVENKGYITGVSLGNYYTKSETNTQISDAIAQETARTESTYLKEHQSLNNYYTSAQTDSAIAQGISGKQDTISDLEDIRKGAASGATALQSVPDTYATKQWVEDKGYITGVSLDGYATEQWVKNQGYITGVSLENYYTKGETNTQISDAIAQETARTETAYLKEHQSLNNYYTSAQTNSAITQGLSTKQNTLTTGDTVGTINGIAFKWGGSINISGGGEGSGVTYYAGDNIEITQKDNKKYINAILTGVTAITDQRYYKTGDTVNSARTTESAQTALDTDTKIENAIAQETARTESAYSKLAHVHSHTAITDWDNIIGTGFTNSSITSLISSLIQRISTLEDELDEVKTQYLKVLNTDGDITISPDTGNTRTITLYKISNNEEQS